MMVFNQTTQYVCAVLLIVSSIALAFFQVARIDDVADGVLIYIAQAFLLAGSIFGLDYYICKFNSFISNGRSQDSVTESGSKRATGAAQ